MTFRDIIEMCARNLFRRKTRTILAIIGVVVGTTAIIVMLSIGFGLTQSFEEQLMSYGNLHKLTLYDWNYQDTSQRERTNVINDKTLAQLEKIDGVTATTPVEEMYMQFQVGKQTASLSVQGVDPKVLEKFNLELESGRLITEKDKDFVLFGGWTKEWFSDPNSKTYQRTTVDYMSAKKIIMSADQFLGYKKLPEWARGQERVEYPQYEVRAAGVLAQAGDDSDYRAYMPLARVQEIKRETAKAEKNRSELNNRSKNYQQAIVYVEDLDKVETIYKELTELEYQVDSPIAWLEEFRKVANMIQMILGGIGGISLFVAALSIANTMIMSIYERTREIGVMKVIGSNLKDIKRMFLMEAGMIGFIGGVSGVILSLIISWLLNHVLAGVLGNFIGGGGGSVISVIPLWLLLGAVAFSTLIGVVAGYSPAKRAMNLSALESLRNE